LDLHFEVNFSTPFSEQSTLAPFVTRSRLQHSRFVGDPSRSTIAPTVEILPVLSPNKVVGITHVPAANSGRTLVRASVSLRFPRFGLPIPDLWPPLKWCFPSKSLRWSFGPNENST
jgi:hypothetical protein